jgi:hypothetical protein
MFFASLVLFAATSINPAENFDDLALSDQIPVIEQEGDEIEDGELIFDGENGADLDEEN